MIAIYFVWDHFLSCFFIYNFILHEFLFLSNSIPILFIVIFFWQVFKINFFTILSFKIKLVRNYASWLNPVQGFHEFWVLKIRSGLKVLLKLAWFFSFLKANVFFFYPFYLEICFIMFYGLLSTGLISSSWFQRLTWVDFCFFGSFFKLNHFNFILQYLFYLKLVFLSFFSIGLSWSYTYDHEVCKLTGFCRLTKILFSLLWG